jgi:cation diffusion facilitator family transporter
MVNQIIKLFIKDYANIGDVNVREKYGKLAGIVGILTNLLLFVMKISTGLIFNSISIIADAVNNFADAGSSVITLVGFKLAGTPADKKHPFGHARYEYIAGLIVSFAILIIGLQLIKTSIHKILNPEPVTFSYLTIFILVVSISIKLWQSYFNKTVGGMINSLALIATAADSRNDVISTSAVLISAIVSELSGWQLDGYMGAGVALFIIYSGYSLIRETISPLLGTVPDKELVEQIQQKINSYEGIIGHHNLIVHDYGPGRCFASVHAEVPLEQDIMVSHDIIDQMEADFLYELNLPMVIHMDPIDTNDERTRDLYGHLKDILHNIAAEAELHDFRVVMGPKHSNLIFDVVIDFDFPTSDEELSQQIANSVKQFNESYRTVIKINRSFI